MDNNRTKRTVFGGIIATFGFLLSPLSWWNDIFLNIPIAYIIGFLFGLISEKLFLPMMILGYWMTNIAGLLLMHFGIKDIVSKEKVCFGKKEKIRYVIISIIYTLLVVVLIQMNIIKLPYEY